MWETRSVGPKPFPRTAFTWSQEHGYVDIGLINGETTYIDDISESGFAVGSFSLDGSTTPCRWIDKTPLPLPTLAGLESSAIAVNSSNVAIGFSAFDLGPPHTRCS
jgi:hypothetical protein